MLTITFTFSALTLLVVLVAAIMAVICLTIGLFSYLQCWGYKEEIEEEITISYYPQRSYPAQVKE